MNKKITVVVVVVVVRSGSFWREIINVRTNSDALTFSPPMICKIAMAMIVLRLKSFMSFYVYLFQYCSVERKL